MSEFTDAMKAENVKKYDGLPPPATPLQGEVREALKKGLLAISQEVKREIIHPSRMRGMYSALDRLGIRCSMDAVEANGIFKRRLD